MKVRSILAFVTVAALVVALAPSVDATCAPAKKFSQWGVGTTGTYFYTEFTQTQTNASVIGALWQTGLRSAANEGTACEDAAWLNPYGGRWYINGLLNGANPANPSIICSPTGCPVGDLTVVVEAPTAGGAEFGVTRIDEGTTSIPYDFSRVGRNLTTVAIPRPRVASSSRTATTFPHNVNLTINIDNVNTGFAGNTPVNASISGFRMMTFVGNADPGRSASLWTASGTTFANDGGVGNAPFAVTCTSATNDVFVATQISYDNGQYFGSLVSAPTRVECDPNLADPKGFKIIDKKNVKTGIEPRR